jgi:hypothetical protein
VKRKLDIYYKEKRRFDMTNAGMQDDYEEFREIFMENHMKCGVVAVLPTEILERLEGFQYPNPLWESPTKQFCSEKQQKRPFSGPLLTFSRATNQCGE